MESNNVKVLNESAEIVEVSRLRVHPNNPRRGNDEVIRQSLRTNGFFGALVVQKSTGYILAGNHRFRAAVALGYKSLPVTWVDVDDERAARILLADNRSSDLGSYNTTDLASLLQELSQTEVGLSGTGYLPEDLEGFLAALGTGLAPAGLDPFKEFEGITDYQQEDLTSAYSCKVHFQTQEDADRFFALLGMTPKMSFWWPEPDGHLGSTVQEMFVAEE